MTFELDQEIASLIRAPRAAAQRTNSSAASESSDSGDRTGEARTETDSEGLTALLEKDS